jgi:hypothetical protein
LSGNIELITRFEYAFRAADHTTIDELCDPGLVDHNSAPGEELTLAVTDLWTQFDGVALMQQLGAI